ncbi:MAG: helix-turn-helix transcriptional regulator [Clostridiaceae bacterium]|nr:helix-turn-helix transcriptional regulator [Clostridiaceae bacterium]
MYKNKNKDGTLNLCGPRLAQMRKSMEPKVSQRMLADRLQLAGLDLDKNAISKIEAGERFVTDIELKVLAEIFHVSTDELVYTEIPHHKKEKKCAALKSN